MTYNQQCEMIYDWYWGNVTSLYTYWEEFLFEEYYPKKESWKKLPRKEMFFIELFDSILDDSDSDFKRKDFTCFETLKLFIHFEGIRYMKRCQNLIHKPNNDEVFPNLLRLFFLKRKKMGYKKFEKYVCETWYDFHLKGELIDRQ